MRLGLLVRFVALLPRLTDRLVPSTTKARRNARGVGGSGASAHVSERIAMATGTPASV
jgi:hypothetical protein